MEVRSSSPAGASKAGRVKMDGVKMAGVKMDGVKMDGAVSLSQSVGVERAGMIARMYILV